MLGRAYRAAGRNADAAAALGQALHIEPGHAETMLTLGMIRVAQGAKDIGFPLCRRGILLGLKTKWRRACGTAIGRIAPILAGIRCAGKSAQERAVWTALFQGKICERFGDDEPALGHYQQAADLAPDHQPSLIGLGRLFVATEQFAAAIPYLERAAAQDHDNAELQIDHANALTATLRFDEATDVLETVFSRGAESPRALQAFGRARTGTGDSKAAREAFKRAIALAPNSADAPFALGRNLQEEGQIEGANRLFLDTLAIDPSYANAYRFLSSNKGLNVGDAAFEYMLTLLESGNISQLNRVRLHFAAATVYEQVGDTDNAFKHLAAGNSLKNVIFDPECCAGYFGRLIETFDKEFFARTRGWGSKDDRPVFIVGMPRSGTSLVKQILASHADVFGAGELEAFNTFVNGLSQRLGTDTAYPDCIANLDRNDAAEMAAEHLETLRDLAPGTRHVSDKMPTNFLHIGLILALFPNARIVHCRRDPRDTCFSIYALDFAGEHTYAYDQTNLGRYYRQYERLMDHWRHVAPDAILDVQYEELVANQEAETRRMLDFCGLDWDENCLDFHKTDRTVRTWSYRQVRQPIYRSSVARWRKFEDHLTPLLDELDVRDAAESVGN